MKNNYAIDCQNYVNEKCTIKCLINLSANFTEAI